MKVLEKRRGIDLFLKIFELLRVVVIVVNSHSRMTSIQLKKFPTEMNQSGRKLK